MHRKMQTKVRLFPLKLWPNYFAVPLVGFRIACAKKRGITIKHALNGKEVRVGGRQLPVDGVSASRGEGGKPIIFQFQGCYWQRSTPGKFNEGKKPHNEKRDKPLTEFLEDSKLKNYLLNTDEVAWRLSL
ncbi:hypothetical protein HOLleu_26351 [Holothuria leucospilota]|uniref:Uncharacterized protein n=1 Tax=Holothuria leucospilota TaxID=206669 RepID=A0A9Q1BTY7_HOLLE|nr:hypothetical protein HOLleu_26351 [Holothuria leucospilota]